ncbi:MAG: hypothetical protein HY917_04335 [Candidatus Diapherotrites archaeon]|nr:hypothetical protein [Candidatus Diapherotrites archaeon]
MIAPSRLSSEQKKISTLLLSAPKTAEALSKQLGIPYDRLLQELKGLIQLKLIEARGSPLQYSLVTSVQEESLRRQELAREDEFRLRLRVVIEAQSIESELLQKQLNSLTDSMKKEPDFTVYDSFIAKIIELKDPQKYSGYVEATLTVRDFRALIRLMYFYGPISVEVLAPEKMDFSLPELQDGLNDMAHMIQSYNDYVISLMSRNELNQFYNKLFARAPDTQPVPLRDSSNPQ